MSKYNDVNRNYDLKCNSINNKEEILGDIIWDKFNYSKDYRFCECIKYKAIDEKGNEIITYDPNLKHKLVEDKIKIVDLNNKKEVHLLNYIIGVDIHRGNECEFSYGRYNNETIICNSFFIGTIDEFFEEIETLYSDDEESKELYAFYQSLFNNLLNKGFITKENKCYKKIKEFNSKISKS